MSARAREFAMVSRLEAAAVHRQQASAFAASLEHGGTLQQPPYALPQMSTSQAIPPQATWLHPYFAGYPEQNVSYGTGFMAPNMHQPFPLPLGCDSLRLRRGSNNMINSPIASLPSWRAPQPPRLESSSRPSTNRRGPPHKPKQSGHACWVGNIRRGRPEATLMQLKDRFSAGLDKDIESVLYIDRSGCAFVNYKTKGACDAAIAQFNATELNDNRLVCRAKRDKSGEVKTLTAQSCDSERKDSRNDSVEVDELSDMISCATVSEEQHSECDEVDWSSEQSVSGTDRYFVLKSFSQEDLDDSRISGVWTAQPSIQSTLHAAFVASKNVYLVFSANKSGAYYGYARMTSSPLDDQAAEQVPKDGSAEGVTITKVEATASAPRGRIVNDPARATLFWEAERDHREGEHHGHSSFIPRKFEIEWMQVRNVEFFRVRGIRNPLNGNKEVKVAKDGTELEAGLGERILRLFKEDCYHEHGKYQPHRW